MHVDIKMMKFLFLGFRVIAIGSRKNTRLSSTLPSNNSTTENAEFLEFFPKKYSFYSVWEL